MSELCQELHFLANKLKFHRFPFDSKSLPLNGIYLLFEDGELAHGANRIVRIGTHTGANQLPSRLKQHFLMENKDRSIFRKHIGRSLLNRDHDPFIEQWELDITTNEAKQKYSKLLDFEKLKSTEKMVTEYIQAHFQFVVKEISEKEMRLHLEAKIISTVSWCKECCPSSIWLGLNSPNQKIRESGLWNVNELYKEPIDEKELRSLFQ